MGGEGGGAHGSAKVDLHGGLDGVAGGGSVGQHVDADPTAIVAAGYECREMVRDVGGEIARVEPDGGDNLGLRSYEIAAIGAALVGLKCRQSAKLHAGAVGMEKHGEVAGALAGELNHYAPLAADKSGGIAAESSGVHPCGAEHSAPAPRPWLFNIGVAAETPDGVEGLLDGSGLHGELRGGLAQKPAQLAGGAAMAELSPGGKLPVVG